MDKELRIKKQEISKEETEEEIKALKKTQKEIRELLDRTNTQTIAYLELKSFLKRLEEQIEINNDILAEINEGIAYLEKFL